MCGLVKIRCRELVKKIAVYKKSLAVSNLFISHSYSSSSSTSLSPPSAYPRRLLFFLFFSSSSVDVDCTVDCVTPLAFI